MAGLIDLDLPPEIDTSAEDPIALVFVPALKVAVRYDVGVGYFTSGWFRLAAAGIASLAKNGGKARWIISHHISPEDWQALELGDRAKTDVLLRKYLELGISDLEKNLQEETRKVLAWMVADGLLEFRVAITRNKLKGGDWHPKYGVIEDKEHNVLAFDGSYNLTEHANINWESLNLFRSWIEPDKERVSAKEHRFLRVWQGKDANVRIYEIDEASRAAIIAPIYGTERPYPAPLIPASGSALEDRFELPPGLSLREYQIQAIDALARNDWRGLLEMATGTGKTITSLAAAQRYARAQSKLAIIILCPFTHLVEQWAKDAKLFRLNPIKCYDTASSWEDDLNSAIVEYNTGIRSYLACIATHATAHSETFVRSVSRLRAPTMVICDEAHHLGAAELRKSLIETYRARVALSATPNRWFDSQGSRILEDYFGGVVFEFPIARAIAEGVLCRYEYFPSVVELTPDEMEEYERLSKKISQLFASGEAGDDDPILKKLLRDRADILNTASRKLDVLRDLIKGHGDVAHALFYCAPGQIDEVIALVGRDLGLRIHRFTSEETTDERMGLLASFAAGDLQGLVAMHCLDEGVDVPSTRVAYVLASSNPREFIQRRGRILRRAPGKDRAMIYDLLACPPVSSFRDKDVLDLERKLFKRELTRFKEFAECAENRFAATEAIWGMARRLGLLDF